MLIVLSESLRASDLRPNLSRKARDALLNLSTAAYEGTHLLAASRLLFGDLQQLAELGPIPTGRFKEASIRGAEALTLTSTTPAMIRVEPCGSAPNAERHPRQRTGHVSPAAGSLRRLFSPRRLPPFG
jgi:hypothetical protein